MLTLVSSESNVIDFLERRKRREEQQVRVEANRWAREVGHPSAEFGPDGGAA